MRNLEMGSISQTSYADQEIQTGWSVPLKSLGQLVPLTWLGHRASR